MTKRVYALIEPDLLVWARESASLSLEDAAQKVQVTEPRLIAWEIGEEQPTVPQLRSLANIYKRPIALFYLSERPSDFKPLTDYRRQANRDRQPPSPNLSLEIRKAMYRRDIAIELSELWGEDFNKFTFETSLPAPVDEIAIEVRSLLRVPIETQLLWNSDRVAFNSWRFALEEAGILVFQAPNVDTREMRGFSITEKPLPVIAVNNADTLYGRIFSLFHEVGHVVLNTSALCTFHDERNDVSEARRIELFCNKFAAAFLVPSEHILSDSLVARKGRSAIWNDYELRELSTRYSVSVEVIFRRLYSLGRVDDDFYWARIGSFPGRRPRRESTSKGFQPQASKVVHNSGQLYSELVLENYYDDRINASDVSDYLDVRLKHLPDIEVLLRDRAREFGRNRSIAG